MKKVDVVEHLLRGRNREPGASGRAFAPANIALCKYWGKRDDELNLPVTSSLSMSLGAFGATTELKPCKGRDRVWLNGRELDEESPFVRRLVLFLDLFRAQHGYEVRTESTVPVAAGLASSASGFAALVLALDALYGWNLEKQARSILARLGSGSACRSVYDGFVEWYAGSRDDGMDSYAEPLPYAWPELRMGWLALSSGEKAIGSREAMRITRDTGALYAAWPEKVADDLVELREALRNRDVEQLGRTAESNALAMHATMLSGQPPILYWLPESVQAMHTVWAARKDGIPVYFTMDAGPNVKLLFVDSDREEILRRFPGLHLVGTARQPMDGRASARPRPKQRR